VAKEIISGIILYMSKERFPELNRGELDKIIKGLQEDSKLSVNAPQSDFSRIVGIKYIKQPHGRPSRLKPEKINTPDIVTISFTPDSVAGILFNLLTERYSNERIGIENKVDTDDGHISLSISPGSLIDTLRKSLVMQVLEMKDVDKLVLISMGEMMEKRHELPKGTTYKSCARFFKDKIDKLHSEPWSGDNWTTIENLHSSLKYLQREGFEPITDEEIVSILESLIEKTLRRQGNNPS